jgi:hypothetical protein
MRSMESEKSRRTIRPWHYIKATYNNINSKYFFGMLIRKFKKSFVIKLVSYLVFLNIRQ